MKFLKYDVRLSLAVLLVVAGTMAGCAFSKDADKTKTSEDPAVTKILLAQQKQDEETKDAQISQGDVHINFEEMPEPNQYNMIVTWPKDVPLVDLTVDTISYDNLKDGSYSVHVIGGSLITIHIRTKVGESPITEMDISATAPLDFILGKDAKKLSQDLSIHGQRLFIYKDNPVFMDGKNVDIEVDKIISEDGNFESFNDQEVDGGKTSDENKLNNSNIVIKAKSIEGRLTFNMIGLYGEDGVSGVVLENQSKLSPAKNGAAGANGVLGASDRPCYSEHCNMASLCTQQPGNGGNGDDGRNGADAKPGGRGGNTGNISITVDDYSQALVQIGYSVGDGGLGAKGAPGHKGGLAGKAGSSQPPCTPAVAGRSGLDGRPGQDSLAGPQGQIGTFIVPKGGDAKTHFVVIDTKQQH